MGSAGAVIAGSIIGGGLGLIGSSKSADAQKSAAKNAAQAELQMYEQSREDLAPWREAGADAVNQLRQMLGLSYYNWIPDEQGAAVQQPDGSYAVPQAQNVLAKTVSPMVARSRAKQEWYRQYGTDSGTPPPEWIANYLAKQRQQQSQQQAPAALPPPEGAAGLPPREGGSYELVPGTGEMAMGEFTESPGYQFTLSEGQKSIQNALSAMGRNRSGAHIKAAAQYAEDLASTEYDNFLRRWYQSLTPYQSMAGLGLTSGQTTGALGSQAASGAAAGQLYAGDAQAAGWMNATNALTGAVNQGANQLLYLNAMRNLPAGQNSLLNNPYQTGKIGYQSPWGTYGR